MQAPYYSALIPTHVLLLSDEEEGMKIEINTLQSLGSSSLVHSASEQEALVFLRKKISAPQPFSASAIPASSKSTNPFRKLDVLVCSDFLGGCSIAFFLRKMAAEPALAQVPVLVAASTEAIAKSLRACGVAAIARPYSIQNFSEATTKAMSPMRQALSLARLDAFCQAEEKKPTRNQWRSLRETRASLGLVEEGVRRMQAKDFLGAEKIFIAILQQEDDCVEACLNMARIARARGDRERTTAFLVRAAAECKIHRRYRHAEAIRALLPKAILESGIYLAEANRQMHQKKFKKAALNFLEHSRERTDQPLYAIVARATQLTDAPVENLTRLCEAYAVLGYAEIAQKLRNRLLSMRRAHTAEEAEFDESSWLDKFPLLRDVVDIASCTAWAWRRA